jgi:hypothetical protein
MDTPANPCRPLARWLLASSAGVRWCGMFPTPDRIASWSRSPTSRRPHDDQHIKTMRSQGQLDVRPWSCLLKDSPVWLMRRTQIR